MKKNVEGILELSGIDVLYLLISLLLSVFVSLKVAGIIGSIIFGSIVILLWKSDSFYNKYTKLILGNESYINYASNGDTDAKGKKRQKEVTNYLACFLFSMILIFNNFSVKESLDFTTYKIMCIMLAIILNSIIGIYLYRKFKSAKQYYISVVLMVIMFAYAFFEMIFLQ